MKNVFLQFPLPFESTEVQDAVTVLENKLNITINYYDWDYDNQTAFINADYTNELAIAIEKYSPIEVLITDGEPDMSEYYNDVQ